MLSSNSSSAGILYYDETAKTAKSIYGNYNNWVYFHEVPSGYLLTSSNGSAIVFFDPVGKTGQLKYSSGWNWGDFVDDELGCVIYPKNMHFIRSVRWNDAERTITEN